MEKKSISWGWTIFWLIIFWPVGLIIAIKKLSSDKTALMSGKTGVLSGIGWVLLVIGCVGFLGESASNNNEPYGWIIASIFAIGGVLVLFKAFKTKKTAIKYKKYIDIVVNQNVRNIDNVAPAVGLSNDAVVKDLQNMIDIGYLKDAYIHQGNNEIVFTQNESVIYAKAPIISQAAVQTKAIRCPGCGANNVVSVGKVSECEYCGTLLNAN